MVAKTREMNRQLNEEIPWFRCSDRKFEDIYYYLWSLYLMYYIDVQKGWEMEPHTQTAVNNFLGMHRYDATFQIKVGAWTGNKSHYAYGNVLTWKHLFNGRSLSKVAERRDRAGRQQGNDVALRCVRHGTVGACPRSVADLPAHGRRRVPA